MSDVDSLLKRASAFAEKHGRELTTVSKWLLADWRRLGEIKAGASFLRPPTLKAALDRLTALEKDGPPRKQTKGSNNGQQDQRTEDVTTETSIQTENRTRRRARR